MAEGYTVSDDGRTYLIKLREGLKWHDGEPVRAQDCAPSLARWAARDTFGQTRGESGGYLGRGGRQDRQDHAEEAVPAADRRDRRMQNCVHDAGAAGEDRSVQGDHRDHRLRPVPLPEGRIRRRQQRRLGEVRRLRAAAGAGGMDLGRQDRQLPAHRVEDHPRCVHRIGRAAERRGGLVRAGAGRPRAAAEAQQRHRHRAVQPAGLHRRHAVQPPAPAVQRRSAAPRGAGGGEPGRLHARDHGRRPLGVAHLPVAVPLRHDLWHRGRSAGAEGRSRSGEEDDQGGRATTARRR